MVIAVLAVLGLCFGSFINALAWRTHEQEISSRKPGGADKNLSVWNGRSLCPQCGHQLAAADLVPVLSWVYLRGCCRYCRRSISWQYPLVELAAAVVFALSYVYWPNSLDSGQKLLLATWLASSVGLLALLVYDWRWMVLPNRIIYPTLAVALAGRLTYIVFYADDRAHSFLSLLASIVVASGIFLALYIAGQGRWIGFGDVRLGLITGTLIADPAPAFLMIFLAALLGTVVALPGLVSRRLTISQRLPFGPFLIIATSVAVLFGVQIVDWYRRIFLS